MDVYIKQIVIYKHFTTATITSTKHVSVTNEIVFDLFIGVRGLGIRIYDKPIPPQETEKIWHGS